MKGNVSFIIPPSAFARRPLSQSSYCHALPNPTFPAFPLI